eukprot:6201811-Pleurochrysis_carterae.AAC.2
MPEGNIKPCKPCWVEVSNLQTPFSCSVRIPKGYIPQHSQGCKKTHGKDLKELCPEGLAVALQGNELTSCYSIA